MLLLSRLLRAAVMAATMGASGMLWAAPPINYADHWNNAAEPGWGLSITQNADILFGALYVYDTGSLPTWYSATMTLVSENGGVRTYSGTLYKTSGPALGQPYNPALLDYRQVGTMTIDFPDDAHGLLNYTIDSIGALKNIERFTFAPNQIAGSYVGSMSDVTFGCANPANDGKVSSDPGPFTIAAENDQTVLRFPTCTINGTWTQQGQVGTIEGTYGCTHGGNGTIKYTGVRSERGGIVGSYVGRDDFNCSFRGNVGGMRVVQ